MQSQKEHFHRYSHAILWRTRYTLTASIGIKRESSSQVVNKFSLFRRLTSHARRKWTRHNWKFLWLFYLFYRGAVHCGHTLTANCQARWWRGDDLGCRTNWVMQQDSDAKHSSKPTTAWVKQKTKYCTHSKSRPQSIWNTAAGPWESCA